MENNWFIVCCCLLLAAAYVNIEGAPFNQQADGPHDVRWRMVSGLEAAYGYSTQLVCDVEPLMNVSKDLKSILTGVCWLLEIQELVSEVRNGSDLHTILEHNILDSCKWLNFLAQLNNTSEVMVSERFLQLNDTCETGDMPRLTQYCLESRLKSFYNDIYLPASDFYTNTVVNQDIPMWLDSTNITSQEADRILDYISMPCLD